MHSPLPFHAGKTWGARAHAEAAAGSTRELSVVRKRWGYGWHRPRDEPRTSEAAVSKIASAQQIIPASRVNSLLHRSVAHDDHAVVGIGELDFATAREDHPIGHHDADADVPGVVGL